MNIKNDNFIFKDLGHFARFAIRCIVNIACVIAGVFIGIKWLIPNWADIITNATIFNVNNLSDKDISILKLMIEQNKLHSADIVVTRLISFYELLIQFLVGLFALFGILGFIYIKFSYRRDISEALQDFIDSKAGNLVLQNMFEEYLKKTEIKPIIEEVFNKEKSSGDIASIIEDNTQIHEQLEQIIKEQYNVRECLDNLLGNFNNMELDDPNNESEN